MSFFSHFERLLLKIPHKYRLKSICWLRCRWNLVPTLSHSQILLECHRVPILSHLSGKLPNCPPTRTGKSPLRTHQHRPSLIPKTTHDLPNSSSQTRPKQSQKNTKTAHFPDPVFPKVTCSGKEKKKPPNKMGVKKHKKTCPFFAF